MPEASSLGHCFAKAHPHTNVISTEAKRSGEIPAFRSHQHNPQTSNEAVQPNKYFVISTGAGRLHVLRSGETCSFTTA
jgi:hypothetical protein